MRDSLYYLDEVKKDLFLLRKWAFLRYFHLRQALKKVLPSISTFLGVGCGAGLAELALAIEFPQIQFTITDLLTPTSPYYQYAQTCAKKWKINNISFSTLNILQPPTLTPFDFVETIEVLEHLENDELAIKHLKQLSQKYLFTLVPYADDKTNNTPGYLEWAFKQHQHYRMGYSIQDIHKKFSSIIQLQGCYWQTSGALFRTKLKQLTDLQICQQQFILEIEAQQDFLENQLPKKYPEAQGIWILTRE